MFSLELLPPDILLDLTLLLNLADITSLIRVLTGNHQQAVIWAFKSSILSAINGGWFMAWGPSLRNPLPATQQSCLLTYSRSQGPGPIKIHISPTSPTVSVPFLVDSASRFELVIDQPDYQYSQIRFTSTRTPSDRTYDSNVIEYHNTTGQRTYKIVMNNVTPHGQYAPFREFLADHMDILIETQDTGGPRERKIVRVVFSFDNMFHFHWYIQINFYL